MQRIPLKEFEPGLKKRLDELWGTPPNLYRALANHPAIVAAWTEFANTLRHGSRTPRALRELLILRSAQVCASKYEWAQHLRMARKAGCEKRRSPRSRPGARSAEFDAREKAALQLAESVTSGRVSDEAYREAMRHFDHHDYVELAVTAGFYALVARVLDAMAVELEPEFRDHQPKLP